MSDFKHPWDPYERRVLLAILFFLLALMLLVLVRRISGSSGVIVWVRPLMTQDDTIEERPM